MLVNDLLLVPILKYHHKGVVARDLPPELIAIHQKYGQALGLAGAGRNRSYRLLVFLHVDALLLSIRCIQYIPIIGRISSRNGAGLCLFGVSPHGPRQNLEQSALYPAWAKAATDSVGRNCPRFDCGFHVGAAPPGRA